MTATCKNVNKNEGDRPQKYHTSQDLGDDVKDLFLARDKNSTIKSYEAKLDEAVGYHHDDLKSKLQLPQSVNLFESK